ncbi:MAG: hypothetical protein ACRD6W_13815 [Nitrososphaerales archaeon]
MKRLAVVALALAVALPLCAQRGGGHLSARGVFAARSTPFFRGAPPFRGSYAPSASFRYTGRPLISPRYAYAPSNRLLSPASGAARLSTVRPSFYQPNHPYAGRHRHRPWGGAGFYAYPIVVAPAFWTYPDDFGMSFDDSDYDNDGLSAYGPEAPPPPPGADAEYLQPPPQAELAAPPPEPEAAPQPPPEPEPQAQPEPQSEPAPAETVTLIFKDGRPAEQIQNYLATRSTITVIEGRRHYDIPIADLNLAATRKVNSEAGVDFQLPSAAPAAAVTP